MRNADWLAKKAIDIHAIMEVPKGLKQPGFDRLPEIEEFAKSDRERKLLAMIRIFRQIGTPSILPPGTPQEQVNILRQAMAKMFNDPEFHKEYKKLVGEEPTPLLRRRHGTRHQRSAARSGDRRSFQKTQRRRTAAGAMNSDGFKSFKKFKPFKSLSGA